jgi:hypothetical protein
MGQAWVGLGLVVLASAGLKLQDAGRALFHYARQQSFKVSKAR